jgi:site-specific recombinase XerD
MGRGSRHQSWGKEYLHNIKPIAVEHWLRNLRELSNGSKCKVRNIMSGIFSHAIRYEFADRNPITAVRQSGKRENNPVVLEIAELHRLFDELELRERAMIVRCSDWDEKKRTDGPAMG